MCYTRDLVELMPQVILPSPSWKSGLKVKLSSVGLCLPLTVLVQQRVNREVVVWSSVNLILHMCVSIFLLSRGLTLGWLPCEGCLCSRLPALYLETGVNLPWCDFWSFKEYRRHSFRAMLVPLMCDSCMELQTTLGCCRGVYGVGQFLSMSSIVYFECGIIHIYLYVLGC